MVSSPRIPCAVRTVLWQFADAGRQFEIICRLGLLPWIVVTLGAFSRAVSCVSFAPGSV